MTRESRTRFCAKIFLYLLREREREREREPLDGHGNFLLEGDNYIWLKILEQTHRGKIDVIYIDPPYNTGKKDFKYNDRFVGEDDSFRHSKWIDFMDKRLRVAQNLLSNKGMLLISCDDREQANIKVLCDEIFGVKNFIANLIIVSNSSKNNAKQIGTTHEYVLVYAKNIELLPSDWQVKKNNVDEFEKRAKQLVARDLSTEEIHKELLELVKYPRFYDFDHYTYADKIGVYQPDQMGGVQNGNVESVIFHPKTGRPCAAPKGGWRYTDEKLQYFLDEDRIVFGEDETTIPRLKRYLCDYLTQTPKSVAFFDSQSSTKWMKANGLDFDFPKAVSLMKYLISLYPGKDITVLDFFAGSGTTAHAVEELNVEDGGNRKWLLVTNNEDQDADDDNPDTGICRDITKPRIDTVITGLRPDGTKYSDGCDSGYSYYQYKFIDRVKRQYERNAYAFFRPYIIDAMIPLAYGASKVEQDEEKMMCVYENDEQRIISFFGDVDENSVDKAVSAYQANTSSTDGDSECNDNNKKIVVLLPEDTPSFKNIQVSQLRNGVEVKHHHSLISYAGYLQ